MEEIMNKYAGKKDFYHSREFKIKESFFPFNPHIKYYTP